MVLWVIGLDERRGVVPASAMDTAKWLAQVAAEFNGIVPDCVDLKIPTESGNLTALVFDTSRRPYVVRNPVHGNTGGGPVSLEVPWRIGTAIRSARREDLIRLLAPLQGLPNIEVLKATATAAEKTRHVVAPSTENVQSLSWYFSLTLYVTPENNDRVVLPIHKASVEFRHGNGSWVSCPILRFSAPQRIGRSGQDPDSHTIATTASEAVIFGSGKLYLCGSYDEPLQTIHNEGPLEIRVRLTPAGSRLRVDSVPPPVPMGAVHHDQQSCGGGNAVRFVLDHL
jgi:hypothetical protein